MPLHTTDDIVELQGVVTVDEAETLATWLREHRDAKIDLGAVEQLHTAVLQVLLAACAPVIAPPIDPFLARWVMPALAGAQAFPNSEGAP